MACILFAIFLLSLAISSVWVPLDQVVTILLGSDSGQPEYVVIHDVRLPRSITALLAGAALGIAGLQMLSLIHI